MKTDINKYLRRWQDTVIGHEKVQEGNDQEMAQSKRNADSKNRGEKKTKIDN